MTGFGGASTRTDGYVVTSEIKTVNNRYLKTAMKISDGFSSLESKIEALLRTTIDRGTVNLFLRIYPEKAGARFQIDRSALDGYLQTATEMEAAGLTMPVGTLVDFFRLPGVIIDGALDRDPSEEAWGAVEANLRTALTALDQMRDREGESMAKNLRDLCAQLTERVGQIEQLAPGVAERYREKLIERVGKIMAERQAELDPADLVREVALFTDKADISEETVRFRSHLDQFDQAMKLSESCGKRLDFLTQEMFREVNTMGSKANQPEITNLVVEMKTIIERVREMVQNVE